MEEHFSWWHHQMETFSALPVLCEETTDHRWIPLTKANDARDFDVFSDLRLNKRLSNQDVADLKRHRAHYCVTVMWIQMVIYPHRNTGSDPSKFVNTSWLWSADAILCHRTWSALVQVMASCLMAPSHYLKQYWLTVNIDSSDFHSMTMFTWILSIPI